MTIKFYDANGNLKETRQVTGKLTSMQSLGLLHNHTGLIEQRFDPWDVVGHCPFSGGRMEIE